MDFFHFFFVFVFVVVVVVTQPLLDLILKNEGSSKESLLKGKD